MASSPCASHYEIVSTNASLTRRSRNQRHVLNQIVACWRKEYLLSLREVRKAKQTGSGPTVKVGDIVILKDDNVKRAFWKLVKVVQLLEGSDGITRATLINVSNEGCPLKILKRSTQHLIPIEVSCTESETDVPPMVVVNETSGDQSEEVVNNTEDSSATQQINTSRPCRQTAILGEQTRKHGLDINIVCSLP